MSHCNASCYLDAGDMYFILPDEQEKNEEKEKENSEEEKNDVFKRIRLKRRRIKRRRTKRIRMKRRGMRRLKRSLVSMVPILSIHVAFSVSIN